MSGIAGSGDPASSRRGMGRNAVKLLAGMQHIRFHLNSNFLRRYLRVEGHRDLLILLGCTLQLEFGCDGIPCLFNDVPCLVGRHTYSAGWHTVSIELLWEPGLLF